MAVMENSDRDDEILLVYKSLLTYLLTDLYAGRYPRAKSPMCKTNLKEPEEPQFT